MLGGGTFTSQNKVLPGSYINVVSKSQPASNLGERGVVALPIALSWGKSGVTTVTAEEFQSKSMQIFGYDYMATEMQSLREVFKYAQKVRVYNLNDNGGVAAKNTYATAKCVGVRGNALKTVIQKNIDDTNKYDVILYLGDVIVDQQTVGASSELKENDFVTWTSAPLGAVAGEALTGGTDATSTATSHQNALNAYETYSFNVLVCADTEYSNLYIEYTKRLRDQKGVKFQTVVVGNAADHEGVVNMLNAQANAIYWVAGALAGCAVNKSCTNMKYDGELEITCAETQTELEGCIKRGEFVFHKVEDETRVLVDINSLVTFTSTKGELFSKNQVIRVADQCANDTAKIFNNEFLGKIQNDASGRISFWNRVVTHRRELETLRAIDKYEVDALTIAQGESRESVVVSEVVTPISAMEKLYMTIVIN